jgi:hypothetical protein
MATFTFKFRRGPASEWIADNPVLAAGEPGVEIDTGKVKLGNGVLSWIDLPYFIDEDRVQDMIEDAVLNGVPGAPGKSAYQVAVDNGFVGTVTQWLTSLIGAQGNPGNPGANGESVTVTLVPAASWPPSADANPLHLYFRVPDA